MNQIEYNPPTERIKYGYFIHHGGDKLLLWGHGSTDNTKDQELIKSQVLVDINSAINMFDGLGVTILMPMLPKHENNQSYPELKLDAQMLTQEVMGLVDEVEVPDSYYRPDLEILKMINKEFGDTEYYVGGVSAGANMASRFAILHPSRIKYLFLLLCGDFIYPVSEIDNLELDYPFGLADIYRLTDTGLNLSKYKQIPQYIYVGELDTDPEYEPFPYELNFNQDNIEKLQNLLGTNKVERTKLYYDFLRSKGFNVSLTLDKNVGHWVGNLAVEEVREFMGA